MAKQRQSVVPAAVMHLVEPRWEAKSRALLPANSRVKTADWRPPLLGLPVKVMPLVQQPAKPPHLEPQD
jgi:hypothetical protein